MSKHHRQALRVSASLLATVLAALPAAPALAQEQRAQASGSVELTDSSVGVGIAYDVLTETLSGIFLSGQPGDSVSLFLPGRRSRGGIASGGPIPGEVLVLSTSSYRLDLVDRI